MKSFFILLVFLTNSYAQSTNEENNSSINLEKSIYYINSNSVRVRSAPASDLKSKILGEVSLNDQVELINPDIVYDNKFVEVRILLTYDKILPSERYFISKEYISDKITDYKDFSGKYFIVVNVATETLRIYERNCLEGNCKNKMIMETEVVVGEDKDHPKEAPGKGRSILGSYRVVGWSKFYQDPEGHYPSWYKDGYPAVPTPDARWNDWFSKEVMPLNSEGKPHGVMRGAFGWYTAFVEPEPYGQWLHGTLGWGSDHDKFIKRVKKPLINVVADPRSSGCTRNNNEAIAFIRKISEIGTPVIKIYAKEALKDSNLDNYKNDGESEWQYVLTKNRNHAIDRSEVLKSLKITSDDLDKFWNAKLAGGDLIIDPKDPLNQILEVGNYKIDNHPDVIKYTPGERLTTFMRKLGRTGNVYGVKSKNMHGEFFIDTGTLEGYSHPEETLEVSGFLDEIVPPFMK